MENVASSTAIGTDPVSSPSSAHTSGRDVAAPPGRRRRAELLATGFVLCGVAYRLAMLIAQVPPTNSDEAVMGLAAWHIRRGQEFPAFFYGQHYMGTIEAYLAAPIFALVEPSVFALRLPNLVWYATFMVLLWALTRRLYGPWPATLTTGLLALGSDRILKNELISGGGYPEINPASTLLLLVSLGLAAGTIRRPLLGYAGWGLLAGFLLWDDWLALPYLVVAGVLLAAFRARELVGRAGLTLVAALLVGAAPMIAHFVAERRDPIPILLSLSGGTGSSWPDRLHGGLLIGIPMGTGMCAPSHCAAWQLWWAAAVPILLVAAGVSAWRGLRRAARAAPATGGREPHERVRQAGRLALVAGAVLSLLAYVRSDAAGSTPVESARYLHCLLISTPALLWPLWRITGSGGARVHAPAGSGTRRVGARLARLGGVAVLAATVLTALLATVAVVRQAPSDARLAQERRELVTTLRQLGVTRLYSDYWTCNNITFASREKIVCAVIGDDLRPGLDRYPAYRAAVRQAADPAYALRSGTALNAAIAARVSATDPTSTVVSVAGYDVYRPSRPLSQPR